ncbi:sporulation protein YpjB [Paenibacillus arenilitoris]|uniref:Sporulation protein YpjB n=1 Tax=Paenibacillus arenilitoris TaxID=2772299 RepID=A0A927CKD7_9BACL|nr:sporulation protein YpjB [Paenibacillus arenilitoris]MBD2869683.1 hypothetical protein [Paenibacillus arenilitoris]
MKVRIIVPFVICIVMSIGSASAVWGGSSSMNPFASVFLPQPQGQLSKLDELANSIYNAAYTGNRQAGFQYVQQLERVLDVAADVLPGHRDGWTAMAKDADAIKLKLLIKGSGAGWLSEASRLRLSADALVHPEHALWLQYETVMLDDLSRTEKAWKRQTGDAAQAARAALDSLRSHAERVEPAVAMLYGSDRMLELKERLRYTDRLLKSAAAPADKDGPVDHSLNALKDAIVRLYENSGAAIAVPAVAPPASANPIGWAMLLGAIISAVLTYSGWRKYRTNPYGSKPIT